eukprot:1156712-Pelagomonas_calceolata.AAC.6
MRADVRAQACRLMPCRQECALSPAGPSRHCGVLVAPQFTHTPVPTTACLRCLGGAEPGACLDGLPFLAGGGLVGGALGAAGADLRRLPGAVEGASGAGSSSAASDASHASWAAG